MHAIRVTGCDRVATLSSFARSICFLIQVSVTTNSETLPELRSCDGRAFAWLRYLLLPMTHCRSGSTNRLARGRRIPIGSSRTINRSHLRSKDGVPTRAHERQDTFHSRKGAQFQVRNRMRANGTRFWSKIKQMTLLDSIPTERVIAPSCPT